MNPQEQSQSLAIMQIDNELIYDKEHILMNYLKMNSFSQNCFSNTNIKISPSILNASFPSETVQNFNQFSTKYFTLFLQYENAIDILCPMILDYHNSEFGLFLTTVLKNHVIEISQSLDNLNDKFNKYKNYLTNLYQSIIKVNNKQILLENICSSITVLIVVGINGNWKDGLELLIGAAKENNGGDCGNVLMASFTPSLGGSIMPINPYKNQVLLYIINIFKNLQISLLPVHLMVQKIILSIHLYSKHL